jgi:hypothetical protein
MRCDSPENDKRGVANKLSAHQIIPAVFVDLANKKPLP